MKKTLSLNDARIQSLKMWISLYQRPCEPTTAARVYIRSTAGFVEIEIDAYSAAAAIDTSTTAAASAPCDECDAELEPGVAVVTSVVTVLDTEFEYDVHELIEPVFCVPAPEIEKPACT